MAKVKNKQTGVEYPVTVDELKKMKENPNFGFAFEEIKSASVPDEVKVLQEAKASKNKTAE